MILLVLFGLQSAISPDAPVDSDIVVIARKLQSIDVDMKLQKRSGRMVLRRCSITRSSGEVALDLVPCTVAQQCIAEGMESRKHLLACVVETSNRRIDAIVAERRATRSDR